MIHLLLPRLNLFHVTVLYVPIGSSSFIPPLGRFLSLLLWIPLLTPLQRWRLNKIPRLLEKHIFQGVGFKPEDFGCRGQPPHPARAPQDAGKG